MMANLKRRLQALEVRFSDSPGAGPHRGTPMAYWRDQAHRQFDLREPGPRFPIEVFRALTREVCPDSMRGGSE